MIYLWKIPDDYPQEFIGRYARKTSPDRFLFLKGTTVPSGGSPPQIEFDISRNELMEFDVLPNSAMVPLVSERVSEMLSQLCPNDIQLIETKVLANGKEVGGYKLLNATRCVNCVNHSDSDYVFIPNTDAIMKFNRLRLKDDCMAGHHIARETEYVSYLYVSEQVKGAFDSNKWQGCAFFPPESVHP
jgi:hypothetical protein